MRFKQLIFKGLNREKSLNFFQKKWTKNKNAVSDKFAEAIF